MKKIFSLVIAASVCVLLCSTYKRQAPQALKDVAPFPIGVAVKASSLENNATYRQLVETEFNSITPENALKWSLVHPQQDKFNFASADSLVDFALANHMRFHGHNLCWGMSNPNWLTNFQGDAAAWDNLLKTHIETVVSHYKGKIAGWDVVNEAFNTDGSLKVEDSHKTAKDDGSIWARHLGQDYIAHAFTYAHEADPSALLFYNDFGQELYPAKVQAIVDMVNGLKRSGVPIDGLGFQMHININSSLTGITDALTQFASTGLKIHISELDVSVNLNNTPGFTYSSDIQKKQSDLYAFVVREYKQIVPKSQQYGITIWSLGDADSWRRASHMDWPFLFDDQDKPKATFYSFEKALQH